ncbi:MAG: ATP-grasp domain-containing protein [Lachnospiraceae bacterium]|jgi:predicted ATP-grasp superfamily ATP-dependent carboligase|nr:ATP-grasp domain-containing protein [Lachnospiraceae bacterium]
MEALRGKKLLILVGGPNMISLVKRAQQFGIYTIVTDYYNTEISPAKKAADEYWDISWSDLDALEQKCRESQIDGITTGYSESPLEMCIKLCDRLGLPCYCTQEQLKFTSDKILFKEVCRKNGVPTVKEYMSVDEVDQFPVIVKPVDRAGSIGVSVANNREELQLAYNYALKMSYSKHVIIEKYITGTKIDVYYAIQEGIITLLTSDDVINAVDNGLKRVVQSSWIYPSRIHEQIVKEVDVPLRTMIKDLGIHNGYIFFSGFEDRGNLMFFEAGFRLCGGHIYNYLEKKGMVNSQDIFIFHALTGSAAGIPCEKELNYNIKCVDINIYAKSGVINSIEGIDEIASMDDCCFTLITGHTGQECTDDKAILDKIGMYYFCSEDTEKLQKDVEKAYSLLKVEDVYGNDMIYDRIDTSVIGNWWD